MLFKAVTAVIYLLSLHGLSFALPTSTPNLRDFNLGFEQTTRHSGPTTTIDYDLADFDEFGNDPGIYDVAGSPDAIKLADDNDQGFANQQGFDTGQSLFDTRYTVAPGVPKIPVNSGGISDEIQENAGIQSEGGPSDEGGNPISNPEQVGKSKQQSSDINQKPYHTNNNIKNSNQFRNGGDIENENQNKSSLNKAPTVSGNIAIPPDSNENDKSTDIYNERQYIQEYGTRQDSKQTPDTSTLTGASQILKEEIIENKPLVNASVNSFSNTRDTGTEKGNVETLDSSRDTSIGYPESESVSVSGEKSESYSPYGSESRDVFSNSRSNEISASESTSIEVISGEEVNDVGFNWKSPSLQNEDAISSGSTDSFGSSSKADSSISQNGRYVFPEKTVESIYAVKSGSQSADDNRSSNENMSQSTSDENMSQSTSDENASQSTSDENASHSTSDENMSQSTSDEDMSQSTSGEKELQLTSDNNSSLISFENKFELSSGETTEHISGNLDVDFDNDNDKSMTITHQISGVKSNIGHDVSDENGGKDTISDKSQEISNCFSSEDEDGKFCPLLRSLYSICSMQFKKECLSSFRDSRESTDKESPNSISGRTTFTDTSASSESVEDSYPNSIDRIAGSKSSPSGSELSSMSIETVENLSASFERSSGLLEVIGIIREACSSVCILADTYNRRQSGSAKAESVIDEDSSASSDEEDSEYRPREAYTNSDEDPNDENFNFSDVISIENHERESAASGDTGSVSSSSSGQYMVYERTNEPSVESLESSGGANSVNSADSSGGLSFEYSSYASGNTSE